MFRVLPIDAEGIVTSKEMRHDFKFAVVGPYRKEYPHLEAAWPCKTKEEADILCAKMNAGSDWPEFEVPWGKGEEDRVCKAYKK